MPGVGPRSAERIALWIVRARNDQPEQIARAITDTRQAIHPCALCGFFTTEEICEICADSSRSTELLCVVEQPTDTTNYLVDLLKNKPVLLTRIARGLPAGGGLESADELTLYQALSGRTKL